LEWLAAMCSHVPNKGEQMVRYYGYYSNVSRGSRKKQNQDGLVPCIPQPDEPSRGYRKTWARFTVYPPLAGPSDRFALVCDTLQQRISRQKHHPPSFDYVVLERSTSCGAICRADRPVRRSALFPGLAGSQDLGSRIQNPVTSIQNSASEAPGL
jgi:hypothetical protein